MTNKDRTKTFFRCFAVVVCLLATIIVAANAWNNPDTSGVVNACAFITLAGSIVGVVKFTKDFTNNQP